MEGLTLVTGVGEATGGKTFRDVGRMLHGLLGTVVSKYSPYEDGGAYTVWLNRLGPSNNRWVLSPPLTWSFSSIQFNLMRQMLQ